jgi:probable phosphoglycerate mutase
MELNYGDYEGQYSADIYKTRPGWKVFRDGSPQGEIPQQISDRADRFITHLRTLDGNIALFSHCQFGCALAAKWIGLPVVEGQHFTLGTTSLGVLGYAPDHEDIPVIALWNWNYLF